MTSIVEPIIARAESDGGRPALRYGPQVVSYRELVRSALSFAGVLAALPSKQRPIAVEATRRVETVTAILGILCSGRAYLPLSPRDPPARRRRIIASAGAEYLVAASGAAYAHVSGAKLIRPPALSVTGDIEHSAVTPTPGSIAYVFFTSGSTGAPKGVPLTHENASAFVGWATGAFDLRPTDRIGACAPLFFDLSIFDLFVGLGAGASLILVPENVAMFGRASVRYLRDAEVSVLYTVPSALRVMLAAWPEQGVLSCLRLLLLAGEPFPTDQLDTLRRVAPRAELYNLYGPIETNVVSAFAVPRNWAAGDPVPIGAAVSGATLGILRDDGTLASTPDVVGEMVVSGPSVFEGYLATDPTPPDPFVELGGRRWYRTGDLCLTRRDDSLAYRGRRDDRIKRQGFLVELGEVEAVLAGAPGVAIAAAVAVGRDTADAAIHGYVVARVGAESVRPREVVRWCSHFLPRYMWPSVVHVVNELPLVSTGKVDRRLLAAVANGGDP